jgi:hypothetical protein
MTVAEVLRDVGAALIRPSGTFSPLGGEKETRSAPR